LEAEERDEPWLFESVTLLCKFLGVLFFSHPTVGELSFALLVQIIVSAVILQVSLGNRLLLWDIGYAGCVVVGFSEELLPVVEVLLVEFFQRTETLQQLVLLGLALVADTINRALQVL